MIVAAGEALVDLFPADARGSHWDARPGGAPLNVAVTAARLGAEAGFLGRLSSDRFGSLLLDHLRASGVAETYVSIGDEPTALAVVEPGGDRREPGFTFHGEGAADRALARADAELAADVRIVHFPGSVTLLCEPAASVLEEVMAASAGRRLVTVDPNVRPTIAGDPTAYGVRLDRWLGRADLVKVSQADLAWLRAGEDVESVAARWLRAGPAAVVVTRGGAGSLVITPQHRVEVPALPVEVADTVGAGDSFMGGLLVWLTEQGAAERPDVGALDAAAWRDALGFSAAVAAVTTSRPGADPPTRLQLDAFLARRRTG